MRLIVVLEQTTLHRITAYSAVYAGRGAFARVRAWHLLLDCRTARVRRRQRGAGRQNVRLKRGSARERTRNLW